MMILLMGVSGSGKTTIGTALAKRMHWIFADADDYHPQANKDKMHAGQPLNDEDRQPWLETLNRLLLEWDSKNISGVLACSALKEKYRTTLSQGLPAKGLQVVFLEGSRELIADRLKSRHHEFMNSTLLDSQFNTLEAPKDALCVVNDRAPEEVVTAILSKLGIEGQ